MQQRVYQTRVHDIDEPRQRLITVWCGLEQRAVDDAIDQWQRRLLVCIDAEDDILNITQAYKLLVRILCRHFYAFMQTFQCSCEECVVF